jgi:hypothetical protein
VVDAARFGGEQPRFEQFDPLEHKVRTALTRITTRALNPSFCIADGATVVGGKMAASLSPELPPDWPWNGFSARFI